MTLCDDISKSVLDGEKMPEIEVNLVFRQINDEGDVYFVAECLEILGCVSQGTTLEEAEANIKDAIRACLTVMLMDAMKRMMDRPFSRDLRGISSQRRLTISQPQPELQYA
ncbi:MAG: type II toxin-antitoxin system HicB family antitoxin [Terracidiphilus sp.]